LTQIHGSLWVFGALHLNIGNVLIQRSELDAAEVELQRSLAYLDQAKIRDLLPELYGLFAELRLKQNDLAAAERDGQQSLDLAREMTAPREEGHNLRIMGEIALARGQVDKAEKYMQDSLALLMQADDEYESARTQLALAEVCLVQRKHSEGLALLDQCRSTFERLQASLDLVTVQTVRAGFSNIN
jgi:ATP/maltotriose-dependent transcriptional regulator MalT